MKGISTNLYLGVQFYNGEQIVWDMGYEFCEKEDCRMSDYNEIINGLRGQIREDIYVAVETKQVPIYSAERKINKHNDNGRYKVLRRYISKDIVSMLGLNINDIISCFGDNVILIEY
jgi:hypothetical protein